MNRRLVALVAAAAVFLPFAPVYALDELDEPEPQQGVLMQVWNGFNDLNYQPWVTAPEGEPCFSGVVPNIEYDWGGAAPAESCDSEYFLLNYSGFLTVPETGAYEFLALADDGWHMTINEQLVNDNWVLKGCGGWWSGPNEGFIQLTAGQSYVLSAWMYEWTGSACTILYYGSPSNYGVVPTEWLTTMPAVAPTPTPTPEASVEPSPSPTEPPTPSPEPSVEPTPTPQPTEAPATPEPSPEPTQPEQTPEPSEEPTNDPTPTATPPDETAEPSPSPEPTEEPEDSPDPSSDPTPVPPDESESPLPDLGEAAEAVAEAAEAVFEVAGESVQAVADGLGDIAAIGEIGKDLDATEKEEAQPMAVAVVSSQIASVAAAAANAARSTTSGSSGGGGGGGGGETGARSRRSRR